jgi:hypothetical protein
MVVAGYLVNPDHQNHPYRMDHDVVNPAVQRTMRDVMKGKPKVPFKKPASSRIALGDQRAIPDVSCVSVAEATSRLRDAGFVASVGAGIGSPCPEGTAAGTEPSGRTVRGGHVSIRVSDGRTTGSPPGAHPPG